MYIAHAHMVAGHQSVVETRLKAIQLALELLLHLSECAQCRTRMAELRLRELLERVAQFNQPPGTRAAGTASLSRVRAHVLSLLHRLCLALLSRENSLSRIALLSGPPSPGAALVRPAGSLQRVHASPGAQRSGAAGVSSGSIVPPAGGTPTSNTGVTGGYKNIAASLSRVDGKRIGGASSSAASRGAGGEAVGRRQEEARRLSEVLKAPAGQVEAELHSGLTRLARKDDGGEAGGRRQGEVKAELHSGMTQLARLLADAELADIASRARGVLEMQGERDGAGGRGGARKALGGDELDLQARGRGIGGDVADGTSSGPVRDSGHMAAEHVDDALHAHARDERSKRGASSGSMGSAQTPRAQDDAERARRARERRLKFLAESAGSSSVLGDLQTERRAASGEHGVWASTVVRQRQEIERLEEEQGQLSKTVATLLEGQDDLDRKLAERDSEIAELRFWRECKSAQTPEDVSVRVWGGSPGGGERQMGGGGGVVVTGDLCLSQSTRVVDSDRLEGVLPPPTRSLTRETAFKTPEQLQHALLAVSPIPPSADSLPQRTQSAERRPLLWTADHVSLQRASVWTNLARRWCNQLVCLCFGAWRLRRRQRRAAALAARRMLLKAWSLAFLEWDSFRRRQKALRFCQ